MQNSGEGIPVVVPDHSENLEPDYVRRLSNPRGDNLLAYWRNQGFGRHVRNPSRRPPSLSWVDVKLMCEEFGTLMNYFIQDPLRNIASQEEKEGFKASFWMA